MMGISGMVLVGLFYLVVGMITASTGGTSLFTVPFLIAFGISPRMAVATNMFALVFHSIGGAWGFSDARRKISKPGLSVMLVLTAVGSSAGALIVVEIDENLLENLIALFAAVMIVTLLWSSDLGVKEKHYARGILIKTFGAVLILVVGVYGGFFSGGYVTILGYIFVLIFGYNFIQAAYLSKVLNICSSTIATVIFFYSGLVDFYLGLVMAAAFLIGSYYGAKYAVIKGSGWVRKLFILMTMILLIRLLLF
jgi:hypothetical protein